MNHEPARRIADTLLNFGRKKKKPRDRFAGFNRRMMAVTIDSLLLLFLTPLVNRLAPLNTEALQGYVIDPDDPHAGRHLLAHIFGNQEFMMSWFSNFMLQMVFWAFFSAIFLHFYSATPGKLLLRMKVVDVRTEGPITDRQVLLRSFGYLVSSAPACLGFLWIAVNKKRRGWHDYMAGTAVINLPMPWNKGNEAPPERTEAPAP
jgi:uncharacterized RDD family membrane protein YckC